jgi:hypothetical protein
MGPEDSLLLFANQMPAVQRATLVVAYLIGFVTAAAGVFYMAFGGGRNSQYGHGLGYGFSMVLGGVAIMNLAPLMTAVGLSVLGAPVMGAEGDGILGMGQIGGSGDAAWVGAIFNILIAIGWIFSLWGLINLSHAGSRRQKGMGAGISRIFAGVLLANPYVTAQILGATFGVQDVVTILVPPPPP